MTLVLNATPMSPTANSYATRAEAVAYMEARLNAAAFLEATDTVKDQALTSATLRLDQEQYSGAKTTTTQALEWPRSGLCYWDGTEIDEDTIPPFLMHATCEEALAQLQQPAAGDTSALAAYSSVSVGPLAVALRDQSVVKPGLCPAASRLLTRYRTGTSSQPRIVRG